MPNYCFCVPVTPGGEKRMKDWVKAEIPSKGHDEVFAAAGITREEVWVQHSPMGDLAVVSFEVKDPALAMNSLALSVHPWAAKFRTFLKDAHGIDLAHPPPPNTKMAEWVARPIVARTW